MPRALAAGLAGWVLAFSLAALPAAQGPHDGEFIFRYDTFGDEQLWTDVLRMHEAAQRLPPRTALAVGLKVDVDALPVSLQQAIPAGGVNLDDPAVTVQLLRLNAVVGIMAHVDGGGRVRELGITCALCHSTVDDSLVPGIGHRLDGWPNRDLNVGEILQLSALPQALKDEFKLWGPGKYDPRHHIFDGDQLQIRFTPSLPVVIPAAAGLQGVGFETYTADGPISYWNAYVGISQMGGQGIFRDPRIDLIIEQRPDRITRKLPALRDYQLSLPPAPPPPNSFDGAAAARGRVVFFGQGKCSTCHVPPTYTDVNTGGNPPLLHDASEIGSTSGYELRSATKQFRTTPLRGVWQRPPYFHDGRAATLLDVVNHYNTLGPPIGPLGLTEQQKLDLVEFLKSL